MGYFTKGLKAIGKGIGKAYVAGASAVGDATIKVGKAAWNAAPGAAEKTGSASLFAARGLGDAALTGIETGGKMALGMGKTLGDIMIDINPERYTDSLFGAGLTGKGKAIVFGAALAGGSIGAYNDYETRQMGMPSGEVVTPTPSAAGYTRFGEEMGATGDLVFAMNRGRRGRF